MVLLSIAIPSKSNQDVLGRNLDDLCEGLSAVEHIELLVHDNSPVPSQHILDLAASHDFLTYICTGGALSVGENFSLAISSCRGDFLSLLGDDDKIIASRIPQLLDELRRTEADALHFPIFDLFFWAGSQNKYLPTIESDTYVRPNSFGRRLIYLIFRLSWATRKLTSFWILAPDLGAFPRAYFGVVRSRVLLNEAAGIRIVGSPDSFLMGTIALVANRFSVFDYEIFVPGTAAKSTSNLSNMRQHIGLITEQRHFKAEDIAALPANTPNSFLPEVIWSASYLTALKITKFGTWHLAFLSMYVAFKYRVDLLAVPSVNGANYGAIERRAKIVMAPVAALAFVANRAIVAVLLLARYKFARRSSE